MLRTCSEPDLTKLFRTQTSDIPFLSPDDHVNASLHVEALEAVLSEVCYHSIDFECCYNDTWSEPIYFTITVFAIEKV